MNRHSYLLSGLSDSEGVSIGFSHDGTNNAAAKMVSYPARALPPNPCRDKSAPISLAELLAWLVAAAF